MITFHIDIDIKGKRTIFLLQNACKILCVMIFFDGTNFDINFDLLFADFFFNLRNFWLFGWKFKI